MTNALHNYFTKKSKKPIWLNINSPQIQKYDLIIGWDTEYQQIPKEMLVNPISYQYSAYHLASDSFQEGVLYSQKLEKVKDKRSYENISLSQFLKKIIQNLELGISYRKVNNFKILLVAHYSVAEFSVLKNREALIPHLTEIRKTLCSFKPFKQKITWDKTHTISVEITWRDTFLLAPEDRSRSLAEISKITSCEKIDLASESHGIKIDKGRLRETLLEVNKPLFEQYGIVDARISLEYYCYYVSSFYELSKNTQEPLTVGDASVKFFLQESKKKGLELGFSEQDQLLKNLLGLDEVKILKNGRQQAKNWRSVNRLVSEYFAALSYLGAINTAYQIGESKQESKLIADCDFSKAYPTVLATIPIIDWAKGTRKDLSLKEIQELEDDVEKDYCKIGFFKVEFKYPKTIFQPALPVNTRAGIIYPLAGISFCTYYELLEAIRQGCGISNANNIESVYFEPLECNGVVLKGFSWFLKFLVDKRQEYTTDKNNPNYKPENEFYNLLLKLMANSFYGKLAQGIIERSVFNLKGERESLKPSQITIPHYAAMTTGIVRTALIAIVNELANTQNCCVLNATTDGFMVSLPKPQNFREEFKTGKKSEILIPQTFKELWPEIYEKIKNLPAIKLLRMGQKNLGLEADNWLEIKHLGDEAYTWKTRGNYINYKGKTQSIARSSIPSWMIKKAEDMREFDKELALKKENFIDKNSEEIEFRKIEETLLTNFRDMKKDKVDLATKISKSGEKRERKIILDYDWKRIENEDGSTKPYKDLAEWEKYYEKRERLHKRGFRASVEKMELSTGIGRIEKNTKQTILRIFMAAYLQLEWKPKLQKYTKTIEILEKWRIKNYPKLPEIKLNTLKSWKKRKFILNSLPSTANVINQINSLAKAVQITIDEKKEKMLFKRK